jgi:cobalt-zinc-cadmium efflux system outer membrane protein
MLRILSVLWLAASVAGAQAADLPEARAMTVRDAATQALEGNAELRAAYEAIAAARGRLLQAGLWPNPEITLSGGSDFAFRNEGERQIAGEIAQRFPIAGRLGRARALARVDVAAAIAEARDFERTLIGDVQRAAFRILSLERSIVVWGEVIGPARELTRVSQRRLEAAEASEVDLNLLAVQVAGFEQERQQLEVERHGEAIRLNQLLQRDVDAPVILVGSLEDTLLDATVVGQIGDGATERRPDLVAARLFVDRARAEAKLARAEAWQDWSFGLGVDAEKQVFANEPLSDPIGTKRDEFLRFGLSVPLPLWNRNQGSIAAAFAEERRAASRVAALEQRVAAEIAAARARVLELSELERRYREAALPQARRNVALLDRGYRQGLSPISALVQAEQQLADATLRHARLLADVRQSEVDLETAAAASPLLKHTPMKEEKP